MNDLNAHTEKMTPLPKTPTGIKGFDEITFGGLPAGRPTLICGSAGSGKTLFGTEFLVRGITEYGEPGVFISFEETERDLSKNVTSLGFDLEKFKAEDKLIVDAILLERSEIEETGEYDLEGLFIRLGFAVDAIGARRIVLDTLEALFSSFENEFILRSEIRRLFRWLKERNLTAVITAEPGENTLTRYGLEEYVSDCVIALDHTVDDQIATRRMRVVKYRGSAHGTNEYPFLIGGDGISIFPVTSVNLEYEVSLDRVPTGIPRLDTMLEGKGFFKGSSILVSGTPGTGKTSIASLFVDAACKRGEKALYFAFEEAPSQIIRNMRSIGIGLGTWLEKDLLRIHAVRPTSYGLELHLATMYNLIREFGPAVVVVDPISSLMPIGNQLQVRMMLMRLIDYLKGNGITTLLTSLVFAATSLEETETAVSSLIDTWLLVKAAEINGERNRTLYLLKSRGMSHSNQVREFLLSDEGVDLIDVYIGPAGVLTGAARITQEAEERTQSLYREEELTRKKRKIERRRRELDMQIAALEADFAAEEEELNLEIRRQEIRGKTVEEERRQMARHRKADRADLRPRVSTR